MEEGVVGAVLAHYTRYGDARSNLRYICRATARRRGTLIRAGRTLPRPLYLGRLSIRRSPFRHPCRFCLRRSPLKSPPFLGRRDDPLQPLRISRRFGFGAVPPVTRIRPPMAGRPSALRSVQFDHAGSQLCSEGCWYKDDRTQKGRPLLPEHSEAAQENSETRSDPSLISNKPMESRGRKL
jgi:hypothetical protein